MLLIAKTLSFAEFSIKLWTEFSNTGASILCVRNSSFVRIWCVRRSTKHASGPFHNRVLKTGSKKSNKLSVTFSNRKPIEPLYEDSQLSQIIDYYNEHLRQHNSIKTPKFSSDIIVCHKKASCSRTKYKKNYNLFHDGIHPNRTLSKLWMYRIIKLASELEYK